MIMKLCCFGERDCPALTFPAEIPYCFRSFCGSYDLAVAAKRRSVILNYHKFNFDLFSCFHLLAPCFFSTPRARAYYIVKDIMSLFEIIIKGRRRHRRRPGF